MNNERSGAAHDAIQGLMIDSGLPHEIQQLVDENGISHTVNYNSRRLLSTKQQDGKKRAIGNQLRNWSKVVVGGKEIDVMGEDGGL